MEKTLVLCPFCDKEQKIEHEKHVVSCSRCGKAFNADPFSHVHPEEFWANPETSVRF